jgi:hypothetical protein
MKWLCNILEDKQNQVPIKARHYSTSLLFPFFTHTHLSLCGEDHPDTHFIPSFFGTYHWGMDEKKPTDTYGRNWLLKS